MSLGLAIGAITFTGSMIAFAKLQALMSGAPITLPGQHKSSTSGSASLLVVLIVLFVATGSQVVFWLIALLSFVLGVPDHHPDRRRRHAGRHLDAELLFGLGGGGHRLHHPEPGADHHRLAGRLLGRDPVLHHVQGHEPQHHQRAARRLRHRGRRRRRPAARRRTAR